MKKIIVIVLVFAAGFAFGQNWQRLAGGLNVGARVIYSDTIDAVLYAGGNFWIADGITSLGIAKWDGTNWYNTPQN